MLLGQVVLARRAGRRAARVQAVQAPASTAGMDESMGFQMMRKGVKVSPPLNAPEQEGPNQQSACPAAASSGSQQEKLLHSES